MLKRIVLGFALVALVIPAGSAKAVPDAGRTYEPAKEVGVRLADPKFGQSDEIGVQNEIGVQLADPKFGQSNEIGVQLADPKFGQSNDVVRSVAPTPQVVGSGGFDWSDAGIGAGILAGLVLLGALGFIATRQLGKAQTA